MRRSLASVITLAVVAVAASVPGCGKSNTPVLPTAPPDPLAAMPAANTPANAVRAFEWAYANGSTVGYPLLFTNDFVFAFAAVDTAGNRYRDEPFTRNDELACFDHMVPNVEAIDLQLDREFAVFDDPRPGIGDPARHKNILTQVILNVTFKDGSQTNIQGKANLFLVRGDAAAIPGSTGLAPDSTRWWIDRWEDETFAGGDGFRIAPTQNKTWGSLKALFR